MTSDQWPAQLAKGIAGQVRRYRLERGMSAQQLSDACAEVGLPIARSVLANFESGRRPTISVAEVFALARALRVPPALLLFPGGGDAIEFLPGHRAGPWRAFRWFNGETRVPIDNFVPVGDLDEDGIPEFYEDPELGWETGALPITLFRQHDRQGLEWFEIPNDIRRLGLSDETANAELVRRRAQVEKALSDTRKMIRQLGLNPPKLADELAHLDEPAPGGQE